MVPQRLVYGVQTLLFVIGDGQRLDVNRSPLVPEDDPALEPVRVFADHHGLVLARSQRMESVTMMFGETIFSTYVNPVLRRDGGEFPEVLPMESFTDVEVSEVGAWAFGLVTAAQGR